MKRIILASALATLLAVAGAAQNLPAYPGQNSLENTITQGLFSNAIDSCFSLGTSFGSVTTPFVFAGASGNPNSFVNTSLNPGLFSGGYYQPGKIPFSFYGSVSGSGLATALANDGTVDTHSSAIVGPISFDWISKSTTYDYAQPSALSALTITLQGFVNLSGVTTGLYFKQEGNWSATDGDSLLYATTVTTHNYNSTVGAVPTATLDYTVNDKTNNINVGSLPAPGTVVPVGTLGADGANEVTNTSTINIPFAFALGKIRSYGFVGLVLSGKDKSGSLSYLESVHANSAVAVIQDEETAITSKVSDTTIKGLYAVVLPGFFMAGKGAEFTAGLALTDVITGQTYSYTDTIKNYNGLTAGAKTAVDGDYANTTATYKSASDIDILAFCSHTIPVLSSETLSFTMKPAAAIDYKQDSYTGVGGILESSVEVYQPLDANFAYTTGVSQKITTVVGGEPAHSSTFAILAALPTAFELKPAGWAFGFYVGATPSMSLTWTTATTSSQTTVKTTETYTNGALSATGIATTVKSASSTTSLTPSFGEIHSFGIFVPLGDKLRLDVSLGGSNLLILDNLTMQLYIPLGK
jgi:hypothetical protein